MADTPTQGYQTVPDSGPPCAYGSPGTEYANEGKGSATKWAKRRYRTAPAENDGE